MTSSDRLLIAAIDTAAHDVEAALRLTRWRRKRLERCLAAARDGAGEASVTGVPVRGQRSATLDTAARQQEIVK